MSAVLKPLASVAAAPLLTFDAVSKRFTRKLDLVEKLAARLGADLHETTVHAVDRVSFSVGEGEVVGLVGESGCGKSTLGRVGCGLYAPSEGTVAYRGQPVTTAAGVRRPIQMIFQDPFASLNPRLRIADVIGEAPRVHGLVDRAGVEDYVAELMRRVGHRLAELPLVPHLRRRPPDVVVDHAPVVLRALYHLPGFDKNRWLGYNQIRTCIQLAGPAIRFRRLAGHVHRSDLRHLLQ